MGAHSRARRLRNKRSARLGVALALPVLGLASCESPEEAPSDYALYSVVLQAFVDETSAEQLLIRPVAAVDDYADMVYAAEDLPYFIKDHPELAEALPDLFEEGRTQMEARPVLHDSFDVTVGHLFLEDGTFMELRHMPFRDAAEQAHASFGPGTRVVCLTPPARVGDHAVVFLAEACWQRNVLGGGHYFLKRDSVGWKVVAHSNWSIN